MNMSSGHSPWKEKPRLLLTTPAAERAAPAFFFGPKKGTRFFSTTPAAQGAAPRFFSVRMNCNPFWAGKMVCVVATTCEATETRTTASRPPQKVFSYCAGLVILQYLWRHLS